ncbi:MAG: ABC transporter permease [Candidatus Rokubacteria bacterium]|nr:ABC transporter permease [Candidatus Rokubacteria bacterium]MBI2491375.1 ABC transporter permease [Candidatus Rokubacteria bacterium]
MSASPGGGRDWAARLHLPTLGAMLLVAAVWSLLSWRYGAYVLPSPLAVLAGFVEILRSGEVWQHTGASLYRILAGFGAAVAAGLLMGLAAFLSRLARGVVQDALAILNATSVFVWIVISIIWFGLSNWAPIFTTFMITLPVVASNLVEGVAGVDRRLLEMGDVYRLSGRQKFTAIVIPSTLPYLVAGMKIGFGLALKVSVVAEIFGVTSGIGYIMNYSREILETQMVFVWALVMILVMMATDKLVFDAAARRLTRWR